MVGRPRTHTTTPSTHTTPGTHHTTPETHTPKPNEPATPRHPGQSGSPGGGKGYRFEPENLHTMEGRIGSTRQKVEGIGQKVAGTNFGAQTMGVLGSGMTGTLNNALGGAQQQVAKASAAVEGARTQTRVAREGFENTEQAGADTLRRLRSDVDGSKTPGSSATTPSNAGGGGGSAPPSAPPGAPPGHGGGGGSGSPPSPGSASPSPAPRSWRDDIKDHFSPGEQRELDSAFHKMAEDPRPGEVPGSGRLTQHERELVAQAQQLVTISPDTRMQKVIPPDDVSKYLDGKYAQVGGFVARQQDATHMSTPDQLVRGNRLDYTGTPYRSGMPEVHVIEFRAGTSGNYQIPLGAPYGGASGLDDANPAVGRASDDMLTAARHSGLDPNGYYRNNAAWPYSGIGVTADADMGVPERTMTSRKDFEDGDMMYKYTATGQKVPVARFDEVTGRWVRL